MIKVLLVALVALAVCTTAGASPGRTYAIQAGKAPSTTAAKKQFRCPYARAGIRFYRNNFVRWQLQRGASIPTWRQPRNCVDAKYLAFVWSERARTSRVQTQKWLVRQRTLFEQTTWIRAMREAQKAYPGTEWWLRSCSSTEGAGRNLSINYFQMNHQGSGAGGYLQFMESTFWRMFWAAKDDVEARGFIVPKSAASWSSRLGQALAGAWGLTHGRRSEWTGSGC